MNNFRKYDVIGFENDDIKVVVVESIMYEGIEYLYVNQITDDEKDLTEKYFVMSVDCNDATLVEVRDPEVLSVLIPKFQKMIEEDIRFEEFNNKYEELNKKIIEIENQKQSEINTKINQQLNVYDYRYSLNILK